MINSWQIEINLEYIINEEYFVIWNQRIISCFFIYFDLNLSSVRIFLSHENLLISDIVFKYLINHRNRMPLTKFSSDFLTTFKSTLNIVALMLCQ